MSTSVVIVLLMAVVIAVVLIAASRRSGPRVTTIERRVEHEKPGEGE